MTTEAGGAKLCCKCGKDLAVQRMKDSDGRYWCPNCHEEDRLVKRYGFAEAGSKAGGSPKAQGDPARAKKIKMLVLVAVLLAAAVLLNMFVF